MVREIITLPARVGICATRLGIRVTTRAAGIAFGTTRRMSGGSKATRPAASAATARESSSTFELDVLLASSPPPPEEAPAAPTPPAVAPARDLGAVPEIPPAHVSEGLRFVEAFAEPGAEEGAGAAVHVEEPWANYSQMTADEVIVRLADATPEELAVVALYEGVHRRRKTVLAEASRRLRSATASGSAAQVRRA